jgi:proteic killer suppression protein
MHIEQVAVTRDNIIHPRSNACSGTVNWVQIDLEKDDHAHLIDPEEKVRPIITLYVNHAESYYAAMIETFKCADTEALFNRQCVARFVNFEAGARRKLEQLNQAGYLDDLRIPPGNLLEALKGERTGQHSIRVNDQFRVCFRWTGTDAEDVESIDYH